MSIYKNIYYIQLKPIYYKKKFFLIKNNNKIRDMLSIVFYFFLIMIKIVEEIIVNLYKMLLFYIFLYEWKFKNFLNLTILYIFIGKLYLKIYTKCYHSIYFYKKIVF